jgi:hypothetical protein
MRWNGDGSMWIISTTWLLVISIRISEARRRRKRRHGDKGLKEGGLNLGFWREWGGRKLGLAAGFGRSGDGWDEVLWQDVIKWLMCRSMRERKMHLIQVADSMYRCILPWIDPCHEFSFVKDLCIDTHDGWIDAYWTHFEIFVILRTWIDAYMFWIDAYWC